MKSKLNYILITSFKSLGITSSSLSISRFKIMLLRPRWRMHDRRRNSDDITLDSRKPSRVLLALHNVTICFSATGSQNPNEVTLRALNEKPASLAWFPIDLIFLSLPTVAAYCGSLTQRRMMSGLTALVTVRSRARSRAPSPQGITVSPGRRPSGRRWRASLMGPRPPSWAILWTVSQYFKESKNAIKTPVRPSKTK